MFFSRINSLTYQLLAHIEPKPKSISFSFNVSKSKMSICKRKMTVEHIFFILLCQFSIWKTKLVAKKKKWIRRVLKIKIFCTKYFLKNQFNLLRYLICSSRRLPKLVMFKWIIKTFVPKLFDQNYFCWKIVVLTFFK